MANKLIWMGAPALPGDEWCGVVGVVVVVVVVVVVAAEAEAELDSVLEMVGATVSVDLTGSVTSRIFCGFFISEVVDFGASPSLFSLTAVVDWADSEVFVSDSLPTTGGAVLSSFFSELDCSGAGTWINSADGTDFEELPFKMVEMLGLGSFFAPVSTKNQNK